MTLAEFQQCLAQRECEGVEFKQSLLGRKEIAEYAVGIGNAGGGKLLMGVSNKPPRKIHPLPPLTVEGIQQILRSVYDAAQIHIVVENFATADGNIVVASIPARPRGHMFHTRDGNT